MKVEIERDVSHLQKKMLHHLAGLIQQRQKEAIKT